MPKPNDETVSEWFIVLLIATIAGAVLGQIAGWISTLVWAW